MSHRPALRIHDTDALKDMVALLFLGEGTVTRWRSRHETDKKPRRATASRRHVANNTQPQTLTELRVTRQQKAHQVSDSRTTNMQVRMTQLTRL